jgi:hypothetical protein
MDNACGCSYGPLYVHAKWGGQRGCEMERGEGEKLLRYGNCIFYFSFQINVVI